MDTGLDLPWEHNHSADHAWVVAVAMVIDVASSRAVHDHRRDFVAKSDSILGNHVVTMMEVAS